jgi:hypothetical protein
MKIEIHLLPLAIHYRGRTYATKTLRCTYSADRVVYKVALLSETSPISQCWFACEGSRWTPVIGQCLEPVLLAAILGALRELDKAPDLVRIKKKRERLVYA